MEDGQILLRWDQVNVIGQNQHPIFGPMDRHKGLFGEQLDHQAFVVRRQVLDYDEA